MADHDRDDLMLRLKRDVVRGMKPESNKNENVEQAVIMQTTILATTDVCLKALSKDVLPLGLPLLLQYDLARQKVCGEL